MPYTISSLGAYLKRTEAYYDPLLIASGSVIPATTMTGVPRAIGDNVQSGGVTYGAVFDKGHLLVPAPVWRPGASSMTVTTRTLATDEVLVALIRTPMAVFAVQVDWLPRLPLRHPGAPASTASAVILKRAAGDTSPVTLLPRPRKPVRRPGIARLRDYLPTTGPELDAYYRASSIALLRGASMTGHLGPGVSPGQGPAWYPTHLLRQGWTNSRGRIGDGKTLQLYRRMSLQRVLDTGNLYEELERGYYIESDIFIPESVFQVFAREPAEFYRKYTLLQVRPFLGSGYFPTVAIVDDSTKHILALTAALSVQKLLNGRTPLGYYATESLSPGVGRSKHVRARIGLVSGPAGTMPTLEHALMGATSRAAIW